MLNLKTGKWIIFFMILNLSFSLSAISIEKLKSNPQRYNGEVVRLRGVVFHKIGIPFTELSVYVLKDRTESIVVFSTFTKEKDDRISIDAEVVAFVGEENENQRERMVSRMEDYLVSQELLEQDKASRVAEISLGIINTITDAATGTWFVIEKEKKGFLNL